MCFHRIRVFKDGFYYFLFGGIYKEFRIPGDSMWNDIALSIPLAIDAGLGELGRNGLLVTPEYGSGVRICKVFTDLPLVWDKQNINFRYKLSNFCKVCYQSGEACETKVISFKPEQDFKGETISNNSSVKKYYINPEKCFEFLAENTSNCSKCITVCPFSNSKIQ